MTFKQYLFQWLAVTVVFAVLAFLLNHFAPTRTLWPFGLAFLYLGFLNLLIGKAIIHVFGKKK